MTKSIVFTLILLLIVGCGQGINSEGPYSAEQTAAASYYAEQGKEMVKELTVQAYFDASGTAQAAYYAELERQGQELTSYISVPTASVRTCPKLSCSVALQLKLNTPVYDPLPVETAPEWLEIYVEGKWYYVHQSDVSEHPVSTSGDIPSIADDCPYGCINPPAGCNIKGNVSFDTGEKIYHSPGDEFYDQTVINTNYGERWFCTTKAAEANGWRHSHQ